MLWEIALTKRAERDLLEIAEWTEQRFGPAQAEIYSEILALALSDLENGPDPVGMKDRGDILPGLRLVHARRRGRAARHLIAFRIHKGVEQTIEVLRILHDQMDIARHIPPTE